MEGRRDGDEAEPISVAPNRPRKPTATSGTFSDDTSLDDEEAHYHEADELLSQGSTPHYPQKHIVREEQGEGNASRSDHSKWIRPCGLIFAILFLGVIFMTSLTKLLESSSSRSTVSSSSHNADSLERMLGIELHPEHHVYRAPKTIAQDWVVTSGVRYPDGVKKDVYLVNGEFPGPTIECRSGDRLVIHVTNDLVDKDISIHWHGLSMRNANAMDGAVGFTQCPISPGGKFTYEFEIEQTTSGTFWWHAHSQVQRGDGMYGGLVVHKPANDETEMSQYGYENEVLLLIGDWYHRSAEEVLAWYMSVRGFGNEVSAPSMFHFS
jgi:FtsP/CotA-like multicopper oxidase with cupredoxin domain